MSARGPVGARGSASPLLSDAARELLRGAVLDGTLLPGEQLADAELIQWLGVSRTPIRAALDDLAEIGLVELSANRWTRVAHPGPDEVRLDLEIWAGLLGVLAARTHWGAGRVRLLRRLLLRADEAVVGLGGGPLGASEVTQVGAVALAVAGPRTHSASRAFVDVSARLALGLVGIGATVPREAWASALGSAVAALDDREPSALADAATAFARAVVSASRAGESSSPERGPVPWGPGGAPA